MSVRRALAVLTITAVIVTPTLGCGPKTADPPVGISDKPGAAFPDRPVTYAFDTLDERPVSSAAHRGKPTILAFVTTGDIVGQAQIDYLVAMAKNDGAKVNYALVALHPRKGDGELHLDRPRRGVHLRAQGGVPRRPCGSVRDDAAGAVRRILRRPHHHHLGPRRPHRVEAHRPRQGR
jgi:hypothetical protein